MKEQWPAEIAFFTNQDKDGAVAKISLCIGDKKVTAKIEFYKGYLLYIKYTYEMNLLPVQYKLKACSIEDLNNPQITQSIVVTSVKLLKPQE